MMRRALGAVVAVAAMVGLLGCQPTEPAMTITAKATQNPGCYDSGTITGGVTPVGSTSQVVLQRTVNGKWQDWKWYTSSEESTWRQPHLLTASPETFEQGYYSIDYLGSVKPSTLHLRLRSSGGTKFSPSLYIKSTC